VAPSPQRLGAGQPHGPVLRAVDSPLPSASVMTTALRVPQTPKLGGMTAVTVPVSPTVARTVARPHTAGPAPGRGLQTFPEPASTPKTTPVHVRAQSGTAAPEPGMTIARVGAVPRPGPEPAAGQSAREMFEQQYQDRVRGVGQRKSVRRSCVACAVLVELMAICRNRTHYEAFHTRYDQKKKKKKHYSGSALYFCPVPQQTQSRKKNRGSKLTPPKATVREGGVYAISSATFIGISSMWVW
jgi:hypothetical protein